MATDKNNIHSLFAKSDDAGLGTIDAATVIRRSRARRLPLKLATGAAVVLVVGGLGFAGIQGALNNAPLASTAGASNERAGEDSSQLFSESTESQFDRAPADKINLCTGAVAEVAPSQSGLELAVDFPDATVGQSSVEGVVTLTNTGTEAVTGYTAAAPAITLAQNGIVLWHSNGAMIALAVDVNLDPGESLEYAAWFQPVMCSVDDDLADGFGEKLPLLPSGEYQVSAAIDVVGESATDLVTGPSQTVVIR
jgi:hypothetical protein